MTSMERNIVEDLYERADDELLLALVGLPGTAKSTIAAKLAAYMRWQGHAAAVFSVSGKRRAALDAGNELADVAQFFDPANEASRKLRDRLVLDTLDEALDWITAGRAGGGGGGGAAAAAANANAAASGVQKRIAIFDSTNSTSVRRREIAEACTTRGVRLLVLESVCTNRLVLESNLIQKARNSPDYRAMNFAAALADLEGRIENYRKIYETVEDSEQMPYVKMVNLNSKVIMNQVFGHLLRKIAFFAANIHVAHRPVWLCRAGHSDDLDERGFVVREEENDSGSDSVQHQTPGKRKRSRLSQLRKTASLSPRGLAFAKYLAAFVEAHQPERYAWYERGYVSVFTSTIQRAVDTAQFVQADHVQRWPALRYRDRGVTEGIDFTELPLALPKVHEDMTNDPFGARIPQGESYADVVARLDGLINEVERQTRPILIVSHLSALRAVYGYLKGVPTSEIPFLDIPQHTVVEMTSTQYGWIEHRFTFSEKEIAPINSRL